MPHRFAPNLVRRALALTAAVALTLAVVGTAAPARAQGETAESWQPTGLTGQALRLATPASGALFARTADGLMRSDDAGATWAPVALPAAPPIPGLPTDAPGSIVVDPTNHAIVYAATADGIFKTVDDARSWAPTLPTVSEAPTFQALAVSPADSQRLYVALTHPQQRRLIVERSRDGGATWDIVDRREVAPQVSCTWMVPLLQAHPVDPERVFLAASCVRTGTQSVLQESRDGGATWATVYEPKLAAPRWLAFGVAGAPGRLLIGINKDDRGGGSLVARSDDDGATWATTLEFSGGGGMSGGGPNVTIGGLAVDPTNPDRIVLGLNATTGTWPTPAPIRTSRDGGLTWTEQAAPIPGPIRDLAYGIDGALVFVATDAGVWRAPAP